MLSLMFGSKMKKGKADAAVAPASSSGGSSSMSAGGRQRVIDITATKRTDKKVNSKVGSDLIRSMNENCAEMRDRFWDVQDIAIHLKEDEQKVETALHDSEDANSALKLFNEEMDGDFELMKHKPRWSKACDAFLTAALGQDKKHPASTEALSQYLVELMQEAEPEVANQKTAFVAKHPLDENTLMVFFATADPPVGLGDGKKLRIRQGAEVPEAVAAAYVVMQTGEGEYNNPHGLERVSKKVLSCAPLKAMNGRTFACVVSGPPAVPDEFLESMTRFAGPLMERVWRQEQARTAVRNAEEFVKSFMISARKLVYVSFKENEKVELTPKTGDDEMVWRWQSLAHTDPDDSKKFVLGLRWRLGEPIGVLRIEMGTFTRISEDVIVLLHTMAIILQEAMETIEELTPGDTPPLQKPDQCLKAFEIKRHECTSILVGEIKVQLEFFDAIKIFSELKHIEPAHVDEQSLQLTQGALHLMGYKKDQVKDWKRIQGLMKNPKALKDKMAEVNAGTDPAFQVKFDTMRKVAGDLDIAKIEERSSAPIKLLSRWLCAVQLTHNIATAEEAEKKDSVIDPMADKLFGTIDADGDGFIQIKELVSFMTKEYTSQVAHRLIRLLDSDGDKKISREEWHKGWKGSVMTDLLVKVKSEKDAAGSSADPNARLARRRQNIGDANALAMHAAAQQHQRSSNGPSEASTNGKPKLKPIKSKDKK